MSIEEEERVAKAGVFDAGRNDKRPERQALGSVMEAPREVPIFATTDVPVSYTHLTLPTIYSV